jgi:Na+/proline symporter
MFTAGVIVSFLLYLAIGYAVGRLVKDENDYYVAGRRAPTILITGSLVASFLSTVAFMGEVGFAYDGYPILLLILVTLNVSGYVIGVLFFGRYLRRSRALTVPEFFGRRFDSRAVQAVVGATVVLGLSVYLIAVTQGLSLVFAELTGLGFGTSLVIVWAAFALFTIFSGSPGVLVTDTVMFFVFLLAGILGMSWIIAEAGGPTAMMASLAAESGKPGIMSWHGLTGEAATMGTPAEALAWAVILGLVWASVVAISPWQTSRYLMARSEHVCLRSGLLAMVACLTLYVFIALGAAAINVFDPAISPSETAIIWAATNVLPSTLGVLMITGIFAAGLSSASTFLSLIGFSAVHDLAPTLGERKHASQLRFDRQVMLAVGLLVLAATFFAPPAVLAIGYFAATLFAASWGPTALLSIYSERVTARGVISGVVAGFITVAVLSGLEEFAGWSLPMWAHPVILGVLANFAATFVGNIGSTPTAKQRAFRDALFVVPEEEMRPERVRATKGFALAAGVVPLLVIAVLYFLYYGPRQTMLAAS